VRILPELRRSFSPGEGKGIRRPLKKSAGATLTDQGCMQPANTACSRNTCQEAVADRQQRATKTLQAVNTWRRPHCGLRKLLGESSQEVPAQGGSLVDTQLCGFTADASIVAPALLPARCNGVAGAPCAASSFQLSTCNRSPVLGRAVWHDDVRHRPHVTQRRKQLLRRRHRVVHLRVRIESWIRNYAPSPECRTQSLELSFWLISFIASESGGKMHAVRLRAAERTGR